MEAAGTGILTEAIDRIEAAGRDTDRIMIREE